ncbi:hypothetical protein T11_7005 [Trichinella zimbabwensis]|uniref:Uncharacterized protein n=1 Tax=Trichinella zimbabwensis TaxID=268475 RepID=A0A0V1IBX1_9BILA|nr:hypothetical protein T11_7005 [Trichinella zimbabwensis]
MQNYKANQRKLWNMELFPDADAIFFFFFFFGSSFLRPMNKKKEKERENGCQGRVMSRETLIASLQRLASLFCVKSFGQCHISQTSTITLEWRFQYLLSLNHNIGAGLSQREVLDRRRASDVD